MEELPGELLPCRQEGQTDGLIGLTLSLFACLNEGIKGRCPAFVGHEGNDCELHFEKQSCEHDRKVMEVKTFVEKVPIPGSRGQSASVHEQFGKLKAEGEEQWKKGTTQKKELNS